MFSTLLLACDLKDFTHTETEKVPTMSGVTKKAQLFKRRRSDERSSAEDWSYPTGMVWCPMKMSGMALMKCAEMQKQLGCGSIKQFKVVTITKPAGVLLYWPWLRRGRECPERADEKEVRELRLALSPLKLVEKSRKNPRAYCCPACGGRKAFSARQCRSCWRLSVGERPRY